MTPMRARSALVPLILALAACSAAPATPATSASHAAPSASPSQASPSASSAPVAAPPGRIVYFRLGSDGALRYFTNNTNGTDEQPLSPIGDCAPCVRWSPDGTRLWTMGATGRGTYSFATMLPDGSDVVVTSPPSETLNLGPGLPSIDGGLIAFDGWDEMDPSQNGVYLGSPDLADLRLVAPLPEGTVRTDPFGVTPDGSHVLFFVDRGETEHAEGDLYIVNADGGGLRQINPPGTTHNWSDLPAGGLSPDGRQAAFSVGDALYVIDVAGGEARQINDGDGFVWAVSWSPTGEWITYTRQYGTTSVVSLIRPDGTEQHELSPNDETNEAAAGVWSPDGKYLLVQRHTPTDPEALGDLWIKDLEGNYVVQVTHEPSEYGNYSWGAPRDP